MRRGVLSAAVLTVCVLAVSLAWPLLAQKGKRSAKDKEKPPELEVVELRIARDGKLVNLDGRVRNISAKPMKGIVLFFEFLESDGKMISRMIADVTKEVVPPGEDSAFETQTKDQSRAVSVRVDAEDAEGRYFRVDRPGPHEIE